MTHQQPRPVHIAALLDRSGSMLRIADDVVDGYNAFIDRQRTTPGDASVTLVEFDSAEPHLVIHDHLAIGRVPRLTPDRYQPRGTTPLLDAIGLFISLLDRSDTDDVDQVVVIVTDGHENASVELRMADVRTLIEDRTGRGWAFSFLAADPASFNEARSMGVGSVGHWQTTPAGTKKMWAAIGANLDLYRAKDKAARLAALGRFLDQTKGDPT